MPSFRKHYTLKIVTIIAAAVFLVNSAVYGVDLQRKACLRVPLKMAEDGEGFEEAMEAVKAGEVYPPEYILFAEEDEYVESPLAKTIKNILSDLKYPESTHDELIKDIMRSFKDINFENLHKEAISIKSLKNKGQQKMFLEKVVKLVGEKKLMRSGNLMNSLKLLIISLNGEYIFSLTKDAEWLKRCGALSQYSIILFRALGFDINGVSMYRHALTLVTSLIDGESAFVDVAFGKVWVFDEKAYYDYSQPNFMILKEKYRDSKSLEEMIAFQKQIMDMEEIDFNIALQDLSSQNFLYLVYCYLQVIEQHGATSIIYFNLGVVYSELREYEKAIDSFKKSLGINSNNASALFFLGIAYDKMGEYEKAIDSYEKALKISPELIEFLPKDIIKKIEDVKSQRNCI